MKGLLFLLVGCPFVGERELMERLDSDEDGFLMGSGVGEDCDDSNPDIHPLAEEVCDGIDNDCNPETIDGGVAYPFYEDADGDGFGNPYVVQSACDDFVVGDGWVEWDVANDCDDTDPGIHPAADEVCGDGVDQNCDTSHGDCDLGGDIALGESDVVLTAETRWPSSSQERLGMLFGIDLTIAGDVNGDGHLDLLIGAANPLHYQEELDWTESGEGGEAHPGSEPSLAFIVYGPFSADRVVDDGTHPVAALVGVSQTGWGATVAAPGDLDGDGLDDVVVGNYGGSFFDQPNLNVFTGAPMGVVLAEDSQGASEVNAGHWFQGYWLSEPGDLDGDGVPDVLSGAPNPGSVSLDESVSSLDVDCLTDVHPVYCGAMHLFSGLDLVNESDGARPKLTLQGLGDGFGMVAEPAGDVDGDGLQELLVSAPKASVGGERYAGVAWLVPGDLVGFQRVEDVAISWVEGAERNDGLGRALHALGDLNQDGYGDFGIGLPGPNIFSNDGTLGGDLPTDAGQVWVFSGPSNSQVGLSAVDLVVRGQSIPGMAGNSLGAGDLDGDGSLDLVVGARENSTTGLLAGAVYVYYAPMVEGASGQTLSAADAVLHGDTHVDLAGYSMAVGGDFNGDGGEDLVIGALGVNEGEGSGYEGAVYLVWSGGH